MLLLLLEHHPRVLALMGKLLRVRRRRRLAEVPAAAGRGCHHGAVVVGGLPVFLLLSATMRNGLCTIGKSVPYFCYVSLPIGQHEDGTLSRRLNGPRATREEGLFCIIAKACLGDAIGD